MHVCVYICVGEPAYMGVYVCTHAPMDVSVCMHMCVGVHVCIHAYLGVSMHACVLMCMEFMWTSYFF